MERKKAGFTIVELMMAVAIIALLVGMLVPAITKVRNMAREARQKAQFLAVEQGLMAFKNDFGDYPESDWISGDSIYEKYCGAQRLAEAIFGWDLMGFHPDSAWRWDGYDSSGGNDTYDPAGNRGDDSLYERKGPYVDPAKASVFLVGDIFPNTGVLAADTFVLCDGFGTTQKVTLKEGKTVLAGAPILYYKANPQLKTIDNGNVDQRIFNAKDNLPIMDIKAIQDGKTHPLRDSGTVYDNFYEFISDPRAETSVRRWPYNPEGYILISAGVDGEYGTNDDICNF